MKPLQALMILLAAAILAVPAVMAAKPISPAPAKPTFERIWGLMPDELVQVALLIKNDRRITEKRIIELRVSVGDTIQVRTGFQKDQFSTRGNLVMLKKINDAWTITSVLVDESGV